MSGVRIMAAFAVALLAACATKPAPAPRPAPVVRPAPPPEPVPAPPAPDEDWRDLPLTPGEWNYSSDAGGSEAHYAGFSLRCDAARRQIILSRAGATGPIRIQTSFGAHMLPPGAAMPAPDPRLDALAFSRGRFTVEAEGLARLVIPAWPEPARVVEDCRG
jgi:hypothetical protein